MNRRIEALRNLGAVTARMLAEIDVHDERSLRDLGAVAAYHRLRFRFGRQVSVIALYAMEAALRDCHWRALDPQTREYLSREAKRTD